MKAEIKEEKPVKKSATGAVFFVCFLIILIISAAFATSLFCYMDKSREADAYAEAGEVYIGAQSFFTELSWNDNFTYGTYSSCDRINSIYPLLAPSLENTLGEPSGEITSITVSTAGTITAMEYTAQNGKALIFDGLSWVVDNTKRFIPEEKPVEGEEESAAEGEEPVTLSEPHENSSSREYSSPAT